MDTRRTTKDLYKDTFQMIHPSEESVMRMTYRTEEHEMEKKRLMPRRRMIAAGVVCCLMLSGIAFAASKIVSFESHAPSAPQCTEYSELPDIYILFITSFDIFGKNDVCYEVKRVLDGYQEVVDNGVHELYFNTKANDDSEIARLLQYFENTDDAVTDYGALSEAVRFYKDTEEGVSAVCDEVRKYGDDRAAQAAAVSKAKEQVRLITTMMTRKGLSLEEALDMSGISMSEYVEDLSLLNTQQSA